MSGSVALLAVLALAALALSLFNFWAVAHVSSALHDSLWREYQRVKKESDEGLCGLEQMAAQGDAMLAYERRRFLEEADQAAKN
jgi:hypothetical protein